MYVLAASVNTGCFLDSTAVKRSYALCIYPNRRKERPTIPPAGALAKKEFILKYLINKTKDFHQIQFLANGAPFGTSCWPLMMRAHSIRIWIQVYYTRRGLAWWQAPLHCDYRHFQPTRELRRTLHTGVIDSVEVWFDTIAASLLHV